MTHALDGEATDDCDAVIQECAGLLNALARSTPNLLKDFSGGIAAEDRAAVAENFAGVAPDFVETLVGDQPA